ncbi:MAG TPA: acetolactate decarboxylase [Paraburkholderia sp.]|jgi:acetolactate decarboxylase
MAQQIPGGKAPADPPVHTLFQVSTAGALVAGLVGGAVSTAVILQHGDFGLGTFAALEGEMIVIDGHVYRARGDGEVLEADLDALAPFAVVTRFAPDIDMTISAAPTLRRLYELCDVARVSSNLFFAVRLDGRFDSVLTRAMAPPQASKRFVDTAIMQHTSTFNDVDGTLIGIWSPGISRALSEPSYHFYFLSQDRTKGGPLLECASRELRLRLGKLTDFHLALPSNGMLSTAGGKGQANDQTGGQTNNQANGQTNAHANNHANNQANDEFTYTARSH